MSNAPSLVLFAATLARAAAPSPPLASPLAEPPSPPVAVNAPADPVASDDILTDSVAAPPSPPAEPEAPAPPAPPATEADEDTLSLALRRESEDFAAPPAPAAGPPLSAPPSPPSASRMPVTE